MQPRLRKAWDKVRAASGKDDAAPRQLVEDFCNALDHEETLVVFSLTSHGMAGCPMSSTVHLCIEFAHGSEGCDDEEDD